MNKIILLIFLVFNSNLFAQKFGYVNSEFILNNMKEYKENLENDGVVVDVPSPSPDASWLDEKKLES